ncbi:transcriptional regulator domain-containing protein [Hyphomicrobium sp.]|uniref:transcriptional regulator domain-containing protein n=1 Tax=Hyphomicrobium sp. TaxID=82 RepID=UPI003FA59A81
MERSRYYVGPPWPPSRGTYDYILSLCPSDLAWEFLRRHCPYQRDYQLSRRGCARQYRTRCQMNLVRMRRRSLRPGVWDLHSFR